MPRKFTYDRDEFARLALEGLTGPELAEHFAISLATVYRGLQRLGVPRPGKPATDPAVRAQVDEAVREAWSRAEIARTFGVSVDWLRKTYPEAGWSLAQRAEFTRDRLYYGDRLHAAPYALDPHYRKAV